MGVGRGGFRARPAGGRLLRKKEPGMDGKEVPGLLDGCLDGSRVGRRHGRTSRIRHAMGALRAEAALDPF